MPVLQESVLEILNVRQDGIYIDATTGSGGHAEAIVRKLGSAGRLIGIDRDDEALRIAGERLSDVRVKLMKGNFSEIDKMIHKDGITAVDGVLFDLGVSSMQLRNPERGFSFMSNALLDMRMDTSQRLSARDIVNGHSEYELERLIREFGDERLSRKIAKAIVVSRERKPIATCAELSSIIEKVYGRRKRIHPATKTFQALRIAVNQELEELTKGLVASLRILKKTGRLCVITYHSIEDRIVKHFIADNAKKGLLRIITKKPITPAPDEIKINPSARSAKLRGAEKL